MPKKKAEFPEEEKVEEVWDVRKIIAGVVVLLLLIFGGLIVTRILLHESIAPASFIPKLPSVQGLSTGPQDSSNSNHITISLPSQQDVQNQIQTIQEQVTHLNVAQIATTSPQVKDILKQIENIPSGPASQVKDACMRLCGNL